LAFGVVHLLHVCAAVSQRRLTLRPQRRGTTPLTTTMFDTRDPVVGYGLWVKGYGLWVMGYGSWVLSYGLWVMVMGYGFQVVSYAS